MDFADRADGTRPDVLADEPSPFAGLALVAHLGRHARLFGRLADLDRFVHAVGQWLLAKDVFAQLQRR